MTTAEEIAKANAWYTQNVGPVTGETTNFREVAAQRVSDPYYGQTAEQRQDAINEQQKHMIAFHPEQYYGVSVGALGNVPLSQIADRYGTAMADKVQQHYADNPTSEAMAYKQEYTMRHGGPGTASAYNDNSAAGIAAMVAATGGVQNPYLAQKAVSEGYYIDPSSISSSSGRSTVVTPIADILPGAIGSSIGDVATVFTPYGEYAQTAVENAKIVVGKTTGELGIYQLLYDPNTGNVRNIMNLVGGGGRAAAQSGMFSYDVPLTPVVYTQESGGTKFDVTANVSEAVKVITSPESYSRLGAEAYGGFVQMLDSRTLTPDSKVSTYDSPYNVANFVEPLGVNVPKSQAPGINLPWEISVASPLVQYADERGLTGEAVGNVVRSLQSQEPVAAITSAPSLIVTGMTRGGALFGAQAADVVGVYKYGTTEQYTVEKTATPTYEQTGLTSYQQSVLGGYSGGLIGYLLFGEKSPEVIKGGIAATLYETTLGVVDLSSKTREVKIEPSTSEVTAVSGGNQTITALGGWLEQNRGSVDRTNPAQVGKFNELVATYNEMQKQNPVVTTTTKTQTVGEEYKWGEFSKWEEGAGKVYQSVVGLDEKKLNVMAETAKATPLTSQTFGFIAGIGMQETLAKHPGSIITGLGAGAIWAMGGEVVGGAVAASPTLTRVAGTTVAKVAPYAAYSGLTAWSVTEGFTATPSVAAMNVGKVIPGMGGMAVGSVAGQMAMGSKLPGGFRTTEIKESGRKTIDLRETIDLSKADVVEPAKARMYEVDLGKLASTREYVPEATKVVATKPKLVEPYKPFEPGIIEGGKVKTTPIAQSGGRSSGGVYGQIMETVEKIDIREVIDLTGATTHLSDLLSSNVGVKAGVIKASRVVLEQQRIKKLGGYFAEMRRRGSVSKGLTAEERAEGLNILDISADELYTTTPMGKVLRSEYEGGISEYEMADILAKEKIQKPDVAISEARALDVAPISIAAQLPSLMREQSVSVGVIPAVASISVQSQSQKAITRVDTFAAELPSQKEIERIDTFAAPVPKEIERIDSVGIIGRVTTTPSVEVLKIPHTEQTQIATPQPPIIVTPAPIITIPPPLIGLPPLPGGGGGGGGWKQGLKRTQLETSYIGPRLFRAPKVKMPKKKRK